MCWYIAITYSSIGNHIVVNKKDHVWLLTENSPTIAGSIWKKTNKRLQIDFFLSVLYFIGFYLYFYVMLISLIYLKYDLDLLNPFYPSNYTIDVTELSLFSGAVHSQYMIIGMTHYSFKVTKRVTINYQNSNTIYG